MDATASKAEETTTAAPVTAPKRARKPKAPKPSSNQSSAASSSPSPSSPPTWRVQLDDLRKALASLNRITDAKSTMPMLHRVKLSAHRDGLTLVATDLGVSMTVELAAHAASTETMEATVECKRLLDLAKILPDGDALIETRTAPMRETRIVAGECEAKVLSDSARDFPKVPSTDGLTWHKIDAALLRGMIEAVIFSVCRDEARFHLLGALLKANKGTLIMVTTDGHRLTKVQHANTGCHLSTGAADTIVPEKALKEIYRFVDERDVAGPVEIALRPLGDGGHIFVRQGNTTLSSKLIDAQFPPYERVIPDNATKQVTVDTAALIRACKRAKLTCSDARGVRLSLVGGKLILTSDHPDMGELRERLAADYLPKHEGYEMGVNPTFMIELLERVSRLPDGGRVVLGMSCELDPILVRSIGDATMRALNEATLLGVVMPMRI